MKLNLQRYWARKDNRFVLFILLLTTLYGFFGFSKNPWQNWEDAAVFFTLVYTIGLYINGFFIKKHFDGLPIHKIGLIVLGILFLGIVTYFLIKNTLHEFFPTNYNASNRWVIMLWLFLASGVLCYIDYQLGNEGRDYSSGYKKIYYYSDLPITVAFFILFLFSIKVNGNKDVNPFFSGSIAFQMMLSNFLWSFLDDKLFDS